MTTVQAKTDTYERIFMNKRFMLWKIVLLLIAILAFLPGTALPQGDTPVATIIKINGKSRIPQE